MLVSLKDIFNKYLGEKQAVAAFNIANIDMLRAVIVAAEKENKPVVIQIFRRMLEYDIIDYLLIVAKFAIERTEIPIALHLDHAINISQIKKAINLGFSSVMIDGSLLNYEDNVSLVLETKKITKPYEISIEAELGGIAPASSTITEREAMFTDPNKAAMFIKDINGVDALAVAIGTAHGIYTEEPKINFNLLKRIITNISVPIVLHGGTGIHNEDIKKVINIGVRKVNIGTELQKFYVDCFQRIIAKNKNNFVPLDVLLKPVREDLTELIRSKIKTISSKAD